MQKFTRLAALLLVALAVVLAITAVGLGRRTAKPAQTATVPPVTVNQNPGSQPSMVQVVVASTALAAGMPIAASSLTLANRPQRVPGSYADVAAVTGSIPVLDIPVDVPITAALLAHGVAMDLKPGERAMAVPVDEQAGAGNRILPGDYVDVFLSLKLPQAAGYGRAPVDGTQTRLLLSRLRVLAYGSQDLPPHQQGGAVVASNGTAVDQKASSNDTRQVSRNAADESKPVPRTAVLAVPVEQANQLLLGVQNGKLSLALRRPNDDGLPNHALFPSPRTVLAARTDLTSDERQLLESPENRAYAGIDGEALAGQDRASPKPVGLRRATIFHGIEVIRGTSDDSSRGVQGRSP